MTKDLNWKHYELRVVHAIERSDELLPQDRGVPLESLIAMLAKEDGVTTALGLGGDNFARYMRMIHALSTHGKVELVARPRDEDPYPGWEVWLPSEEEESPKVFGNLTARDLLMAIVPVLSGLGAASLIPKEKAPEWHAVPVAKPTISPDAPMANVDPADMAEIARQAVLSLPKREIDALIAAGFCRFDKNGVLEFPRFDDEEDEDDWDNRGIPPVSNPMGTPRDEVIITPPPAAQEPA